MDAADEDVTTSDSSVSDGDMETTPDSAEPESTIDTEVPGETAVTETGTPVDADATVSDCDPTEIAPTDAVYASPVISTAPADGSLTSPYKTIGEALASAKTKGRARVILDAGTYNESLKFADSDPGIVIEGGWKRDTGGNWKRNCAANARDATVLQSNALIAISVDDVKAPSGIKRMTVRTKAAGGNLLDGAGESLYGVRVRGAGSRFSIDDSVIEAGLGGSGLPGTSGTVSGATCDGVSDCKDGASGPGGPSGPNALAGTFTAFGYQAGNGAAGTAGSPGANGTAGSMKSISCITDCGSSTCKTMIDCPRTYSVVVDSKGTCGCGGGGGPAGGGGGGGGASVGVLITGAGAKVTITRSVVKATNGGSGANGASGGGGAMGTSGKAGVGYSCPQACNAFTGGTCGAGQYYCAMGGNVAVGGASAGGNGGKGGNGGNGGGGAGGPSHAIVMVAGGDSIVDMESMLKAGTGGGGASGAPAGAATPKVTIP